MKPFATLGNLILDIRLQIERFPIRADEHQSAQALALEPGGAGNALVAAARLGLRARALGHVGADWIGRHLLAQLAAEAVETRDVALLPGEATRAE